MLDGKGFSREEVDALFENRKRTPMSKEQRQKYLARLKQTAQWCSGSTLVSETKGVRFDSFLGNFKQKEAMDLNEAITSVVEAGFEVFNHRGGYVSKDDRFGWYHQTCYRSTQEYGLDKQGAIDSFLSESETNNSGHATS